MVFELFYKPAHRTKKKLVSAFLAILIVAHVSPC